MQPGKALKHLQGTVFSAEALSRPARPAFFLPFCCRHTPLVGARCAQTSAGPPVRPLFFLSAAGALLWLVLAVDKRVRPGKAREAKLLWLAAPSGPIALLHIGLKRDVRHPAAAEQAAGALLWFVLAAAKRVRPPSALDAKLFLLVVPWGPIAFYSTSTFYIGFKSDVRHPAAAEQPPLARRTANQKGERPGIGER